MYSWTGNQSLAANAVFALPTVSLPVGKTRSDLVVSVWATTNNRVFLINERSVTAGQTNIALEANNWHTSTFSLTELRAEMRAVDV